MATIKERKDQDGKTRFQAIIRLKGQPTQTATFGRITDAKKWIQQTESAIREGRYFKTSAAKRYTLAEMIRTLSPKVHFSESFSSQEVARGLLKNGFVLEKLKIFVSQPDLFRAAL